MRKIAILVSIILLTMILLFFGSFVIAQNNNEIAEKENSQKEFFIQYLQEKINELPEEEKAQFEEYQKIEPSELFLNNIENLQSGD